jgi:hypothetical protein
MLTCVNAIASLYCCIYLIHNLHHNLLGCCNYLMMQSYLCQMVCTRANGDNVLDVPKGFEGSEKATRGGVNGSQSKFLVGTWHISQIEPDTPLF